MRLGAVYRHPGIAIRTDGCIAGDIRVVAFMRARVDLRERDGRVEGVGRRAVGLAVVAPDILPLIVAVLVPLPVVVTAAVILKVVRAAGRDIADLVGAELPGDVVRAVLSRNLSDPLGIDDLFSVPFGKERQRLNFAYPLDFLPVN